METFDAGEAIRYATQRRKEAADSLRKMRRDLAGLTPVSLHRAAVNRAVRASAMPRWVPESVTVPALRRQLENLTWAASAPMPDYTQDDGYSMCGAEDGFAEAKESARRMAHETLSMLIYQMDYERDTRW